MINFVDLLKEMIRANDVPDPDPYQSSLVTWLEKRSKLLRIAMTHGCKTRTHHTNREIIITGLYRLPWEQLKQTRLIWWTIAISIDSYCMDKTMWWHTNMTNRANYSQHRSKMVAQYAEQPYHELWQIHVDNWRLYDDSWRDGIFYSQQPISNIENENVNCTRVYYRIPRINFSVIKELTCFLFQVTNWSEFNSQKIWGRTEESRFCPIVRQWGRCRWVHR